MQLVLGIWTSIHAISCCRCEKSKEVLIVIVRYSNATELAGLMFITRPTFYMATFDTLTIKPYRERVNNWSNTLACYPGLVFEPTSAEEVQLIVNEARRRRCRVRPVGEHASPGEAFITGKDDVSRV